MHGHVEALLCFSSIQMCAIIQIIHYIVKNNKSKYSSLQFLAYVLKHAYTVPSDILLGICNYAFLQYKHKHTDKKQDNN